MALKVCYCGNRLSLTSLQEVEVAEGTIIVSPCSDHMKWLPRLSRASFADWFDWQRRDRRDAGVILGITVLAYVAGHYYELPSKLTQFAADYSDTEVDDIIFVVFVLSIALMAYGFRRYQ